MTAPTVLNLALRPATGTRFQPTGFPDLGAAVFQAPDGKGNWVPSLHLESPQSMANRLELTTWDTVRQDQAAVLEGIPYVRIVDSDGQFLTSSRLEAHRLASAYVMTAKHGSQTGREWLPSLLGVAKNKALDHQAVAKAIFALDPVSLIHGVFFAQKEWAWQPKVARAITCFIDATDVQAAVSGGVKTDSVNPRAEEGRGTSEGFGMVPHQRTEYTAQRITASIVVDRDQIHAYGLSPEAEALLLALIDFELASLFRQGWLRLRTSCHLTADEDDPGLAHIPTIEDATAAVQQAISRCGELAKITEMVWTGGGK